MQFKITMIGTGYVGLVSGVCFSDLGHYVTCIDIDENKIKMCQDGKSPIYEPGLSDLMERNIKQGRLHFSTNFSSIATTNACFLAVGTPSADDGRANMNYLKEAAKSVAKNIGDNCPTIVIKSTVPIGTAKEIEKIIKENTRKPFYIVNNPEFLKEGSAINDFMRPDRVVIGHNNEKAYNLMAELYEPLVRQGNPILSMSNESAEATKYAANCFLAAKISFINEIAKLCDKVGADINEVRKGISTDQRIGKHFLYPGPGYGGSCFPKDVKALMRIAEDHNLNLRIVEASEIVNEEQKIYMVGKVLKHFNEKIEGKTFTLWGAAFKPNTDDVRESPAIAITKRLIELGANVKIYDPIALENFLKEFKNYAKINKITPCNDKNKALEGSSGLIVITDWPEFKVPDYELIANALKEKVVFDCRNLLRQDKLNEVGVKYYSIGLKSIV